MKSSYPRRAARTGRVALLAVLLLGLAVPALAQTRTILTGQVLDGTTDQGIPGALVSIPALRIDVLANQAGTFNIPSLPLGEHRFEIRALGYQSIAIDVLVREGIALNFQIMPDPIVLEGLEVTASRLDQRFDRVGRAAQKFERERILSGSYPNVLELVVALGIQQSRTEGQMAHGGRNRGNQAWVRGMSQHVEIWIDDRRAYGGFGELEDTHPFDIYRIEWFPGARPPNLRLYTTRYIEHLARTRGQLPRLVL